MSKKINVQGHVARYTDTDLSDIAALIEGLTDLIETRKSDTIAQLEQALAALKKGEIPPPPPTPERTTPKRTRGGKKVITEE